MERVASLDLGTNTFRLLIAEIRENLEVLRIRRDITRLGEGFLPKRELTSLSVSRSLKVLSEYAQILAREGVPPHQVFAVATSVLREAKNKEQFMTMVLDETGINVRVISAEEEARLTLEGVLWGVEKKSLPNVILDIGGGSTEFIFSEGLLPLEIRSLNLGVVYLTERFLRNDPPSSSELKALEEGIEREIRAMGIEPSLRQKGSNLIGTAGTITTLAAIEQGLEVYEPKKINNFLLKKSSIEKHYHKLKETPHKDRRGIPGLEKGREDVIISGAALLLKIMEIFNFEELIVSDTGLLEGILLEKLRKNPSFNCHFS